MRKYLARIAYKLLRDEINELAATPLDVPIAVVVNTPMTKAAAEQVARIATARIGKRVSVSYRAPSGDRTVAHPGET